MEKSYNTNLASEFYVLSMLHRLGLDCYLTLGNKKAVDIIVTKGDIQLTIDVKGALYGDFPIGNNYKKGANHFYVFVQYNHKFLNTLESPDVYLLPSEKVDSFLGSSVKVPVVKWKELRENGTHFLNNWQLLLS